MQNVNFEKYENPEKVKAYVEKVSKANEELNEKFKKLQEEVEKDLCVIDKDRLAEEANRNISKYHRYVTKLAEERMNASKTKNTRSQYEAELFDYYRFNWDKSTKLTESAIQKYVYGHQIYLAISSFLINIEIIIQYLESIVEAFAQRNWTIKNIIEVKKIDLGLA
jgi:hypothetical protein